MRRRDFLEFLGALSAGGFLRKLPAAKAERPIAALTVDGDISELAKAVDKSNLLAIPEPEVIHVEYPREPGVLPPPDYWTLSVQTAQTGFWGEIRPEFEAELTWNSVDSATANAIRAEFGLGRKVAPRIELPHGDVVTMYGYVQGRNIDMPGGDGTTITVDLVGTHVEYELPPDGVEGATWERLSES